MDYNKFTTASNAQKTITGLTSLSDLIKSDGNWDKLKTCDRWYIAIQNTGTLRMFYNGNTPTDSLGDIVSAGVIIQGANPDDILMIPDAASAENPAIFIAPQVMIYGHSLS